MPKNLKLTFFSAGKVLDLVELGDAYEVAVSSLANIDTLAFLLGAIDGESLKEEDSDSLRCYFKGVAELIATFSSAAAEQIWKLEDFRKQQEKAKSDK